MAEWAIFESRSDDEMRLVGLSPAALRNRVPYHRRGPCQNSACFWPRTFKTMIRPPLRIKGTAKEFHVMEPHLIQKDI